MDTKTFVPGPQTGGQRQVGRYSLLYRFASGGMGDVYVARLTGEEGFERLVAIKLIHEHLTEQPQFVKMFIDEARLASRISHPNVALTLDLGKTGKTHFIAMEYVNGESVVALLRRVKPPPTYCARIIADAAAGLHAAHELRGADGEPLHVVHRDVSPQNILMTYDGVVKVVDFGVARARGSLHTTAGEIKGKFSYMAPEQLRAPKSVDRRADVFALGIVLYEMTTWKRLFAGEEQDDQVAKVLACNVPLPSLLVPAYPDELERIVVRALSPKPEDRYATARELQQELEHFIVASGSPVLSAAIGEMMHKVFPDRIKEKQTLLELCARQKDPSTAVPVPTEPSAGSSLVLGSVASLFTTRRRKVAAWLVVGVVLMGAAALAVPYALNAWHAGEGRASVRTGGRPSRVPASGPAAPAKPAPREIVISVRALPAGATIRFAGETVANPFEVRQPVRNGHSEAEISAPGYVTQRLRVPLDSGGAWAVELQRAATAAVEPRRKRQPVPPKRRPRPSGKQGIADEDVLDSPYK